MTERSNPKGDRIEIATTLRRAAGEMLDAAEHFKLLSEVLRQLAAEAKPHLGTTSATLLAATISVWSARQSARELEAVHKTLLKEADRYAR